MQPQNQAQVDQVTAIETFNSLLSGELSAVETYRQAIARLGAEAPVELSTCQQSHDLRATRMAEHIALSSGTPVTASGLLWQEFERLVKGDSVEGRLAAGDQAEGDQATGDQVEGNLAGGDLATGDQAEDSTVPITPRALYAALEAGEDQVLTDYRAALDRVDSGGLTLIRDHLLPEQIRTHGLMSGLCRHCG